MIKIKIWRFMLAFFFGVGSFTGFATADDKVKLELDGKHKSVFSRITYNIPKGWVVTDGESDWLAPSKDKYFWQPGFDPDKDTFYVVSGIPPFLTLDDRREKRVRSLEDVANATVHSLQVAADATLTAPPNSFSLNGKKAMSYSANMDEQQEFYQVFVQISDNEIATVAAQGPREKVDEFSALVDAIASTIAPGK